MFFQLNSAVLDLPDGSTVHIVCSFKKRGWVFFVDIMELERFGTEEDNDEDDAAIQYMIEQSLLESIKQMETSRDTARADTRRSAMETNIRSIYVC